MTDKKYITPNDKPLQKRDDSQPHPRPLNEEKSTVITNRDRDPPPYPGEKPKTKSD